MHVEYEADVGVVGGAELTLQASREGSLGKWHLSQDLKGDLNMLLG